MKNEWNSWFELYSELGISEINSLIDQTHLPYKVLVWLAFEVVDWTHRYGVEGAEPVLRLYEYEYRRILDLKEKK